MLHYSQMSSATRIQKQTHTRFEEREREIRKESVRHQSFAHARAHTQGTDANMLKEETAYTTTIKESPNTDARTHTDTQTHKQSHLTSSKLVSADPHIQPHLNPALQIKPL